MEEIRTTTPAPSVNPGAETSGASEPSFVGALEANQMVVGIMADRLYQHEHRSKVWCH